MLVVPNLPWGKAGKSAHTASNIVFSAIGETAAARLTSFPLIAGILGCKPAVLRLSCGSAMALSALPGGLQNEMF